MWPYVAPLWLPDGHLQTIYPAVWGARQVPFECALSRERWMTPDGDFIHVDRDNAVVARSTPQHSRPLLVLFHGLEGSSASHYALGFRRFAQHVGLDFAVPHFRGCSGELNVAPRAYHSGDTAEIDWVLRCFKAECPTRDVWAVGVSLGGNALMRWAGEMGASASRVVRAVAAVCAPLDLTASGHAMGRGFNRHVYTRMFLRTMLPKAMRKWQQYPGLFSKDQLASARTLYEFDNAFTAPVHGYRDAEDYWHRASARPVLAHIRIPALLLNAKNDPFVPTSSLPGHTDVASCVCCWQPQDGGHVGFPANTRRSVDLAPIMAMPNAVGHWLLAH